MPHDQASSTEIDHQEILLRYRAILASTLDPLIVIDSYGTIQEVSDSIYRVFGWTPEELIGRNITVLMPQPHQSKHDDYLKNYRQTGVTNILGRAREFEAVRKDGSCVPIVLSVSRVDIPGRDHPLFTGIIHDVTEQRRNEEELRRHREHLEALVDERTSALESTHEQLRQADRFATIGTLAAGLGHDMNNVLLPVRCRLDVLEAADLPAHLREQFHSMRDSIAYLQQLTDGLRLLALDPEDAQASVGVTDLNQWWNQMSPLLIKAVPRQIKLETDFPSELPAAHIEPHRLTQAVLNLLVNATEAITHDDGLVRLWARSTSEGMIELGVTDNGQGMNPEIKHRALDPFFTTKKRGLGTGLGLALVQGVTVSAGGSVTIDSAIGKGTTVLLTLHAADSLHAQTTSTEALPEQAVVSTNDQRLGSLIGTLLEAAAIEVTINGKGSPGNVDLWITDPNENSLIDARRFVQTPGRCLVLIGSCTSPWKALKAIIIENPDNFGLLREKITEAVASIRGTAS